MAIVSLLITSVVADHRAAVRDVGLSYLDSSRMSAHSILGEEVGAKKQNDAFEWSVGKEQHMGEQKQLEGPGHIVHVYPNFDATINDLVDPTETVSIGQAKVTPLQMMFGIAFDLVLVGGCWFFCCMGQKRATNRVESADLNGDFRPVGLCSCIKLRWTTVCEACFCSVCMWAENVGKLQVLPFAMAVISVGAAIILGPITAGLSCLLFLCARVYVRQHMRKTLNQSTGSRCRDVACDCLVHLCCALCATTQEVEFLEHYEEHGCAKECSA